MELFVIIHQLLSQRFLQWFFCELSHRFLQKFVFRDSTSSSSDASSIAYPYFFSVSADISADFFFAEFSQRKPRVDFVPLFTWKTSEDLLIILVNLWRNLQRINLWKNFPMIFLWNQQRNLRNDSLEIYR